MSDAKRSKGAYPTYVDRLPRELNAHIYDKFVGGRCGALTNGGTTCLLRSQFTTTDGEQIYCNKFCAKHADRWMGKVFKTLFEHVVIELKNQTTNHLIRKLSLINRTNIDVYLAGVVVIFEITDQYVIKIAVSDGYDDTDQNVIDQLKSFWSGISDYVPSNEDIQSDHYIIEQTLDLQQYKKWLQYTTRFAQQLKINDFAIVCVLACPVKTDFNDHDYEMRVPGLFLAPARPKDKKRCQDGFTTKYELEGSFDIEILDDFFNQYSEDL